jgi:hypothetical protein
MNNKNPAAYEDHAHFRIPADFMPRILLVARRKGLTAAGFMRMAILDALQRSGVSPVGQKQDVGTQ